MARTKRKINPILPVPAPEVPKARIYRTGGYVRLSVEDSGKPGADTIEAQKALVLEYIQAQEDMTFCGLFCDNGRTGTNFDRPGFEALMEEVRSGKIDCIVVKDLSRFGRNYKETGIYLERIFPFLDVRFVAVNDHFDTLTAERFQDGYIVPLKNMMNEVYSKDISRKVSSALAAKRHNGEYIGAFAPYGYKKCDRNPSRLEPDWETALIVQKIFQWRLYGMGYQRIAQGLNRLGIPSPARLHYQRGETAAECYANAKWNVPGIKMILSNQVYLGHLVQGRRRSGLLRGQTEERAPESEWVITRHAHEALIEEEVFQSVQTLAEKGRSAFFQRLGRYEALGTRPNLFRGLVFCADCGHRMMRHKFVSKREQRLSYAYLCPVHAQHRTACSKKYLQETALEAVLWETVRREVALAEDLEKQLSQYRHSARAAAQETAFSQEIASVRQVLNRAKRLYESLYPNYVEKLVTEQEYLTLKKQYQSDIEHAQARLNELEQQKQEQRRQISENPWLTACDQFQAETELTEGMAHTLIERVEVDAENRISIKLRYRDEYHALIQLLEEAGKAVDV